MKIGASDLALSAVFHQRVDGELAPFSYCYSSVDYSREEVEQLGERVFSYHLWLLEVPVC